MKNQTEIIQQVQSFDPSLATATVKFAADDTLEIYPSDEQNYKDIQIEKALWKDREFLITLQDLGVAQAQIYTAKGEPTGRLLVVADQIEMIDMMKEILAEAPMNITIIANRRRSDLHTHVIDRRSRFTR